MSSKPTSNAKSDDDIYASVELSNVLPKTKFPEHEQNPRNVFSAVRDELMLIVVPGFETVV